jgi:aminoglycoside phosphotransferase (APT) family kinase protein
MTNAHRPAPVSRDRHDIYYWKCDRTAAFHGTDASLPDNPAFEAQLLQALQTRFPGTPVTLRTAHGQGNHRTFRLTLGTREAFVRTEDGPEQDNYFNVEAVVMARLQACGIPVPHLLACDCDRTATPFAWQVLDYIPFPDLNQLYKQGELSLDQTAGKIGAAVARWQDIRPAGFGPFSASAAHDGGTLQGLHNSYESYFTLNLSRHVAFLVDQGFFDQEQAATVLDTIDRHRPLLQLQQGCLVHKDLALWNILGTARQIAAFIDWDDAISGDPMDDLSLLGCFYDAPVIRRALSGYAGVRPLPPDAMPRFWLHLLRNMLVKAVIRVGAGYFRRNDSFFLIGAGTTGADLEAMTHARIDTALRGLNENRELSYLCTPAP